MPELKRDVLAALAVGLDETMADRGSGVGRRAGLEVVVDEVHLRGVVAAIDGAMSPVEHDIVHVIEIPTQPHRAIPACVAGEEIVMERVVASAPRSAEG